MSNYSPTAGLDTIYSLPDDGDDLDAASVNIVFEPLADGIAASFVSREFINNGDETELGSAITANSDLTYIASLKVWLNPAFVTGNILHVRAMVHAATTYTQDQPIRMALYINDTGTLGQIVPGSIIRISDTLDIASYILEGEIEFAADTVGEVTLALMGEAHSTSSLWAFGPSTLTIEARKI